MIKKNDKEDLETNVFGTIKPVGRDEFAAAGQRGMKAKVMIEIWGCEYENQEELKVDGKRMNIYRTYGPKENEKIELYAGEKVGKK